MNNKSLFFSVLLVAALLLSACSGAAPAAPAQAPAAETTEAAAAPAGEAAEPAAVPDVDTTGLNLDAAGTFSYWNGFTASDRPVMEENVRVFDELYPNVTVNMDIQPWDSILPKLLPSMRSGSDPDLVSLDASLIPQYVKAGVLKPVDDLWGCRRHRPCQVLRRRTARHDRGRQKVRRADHLLHDAAVYEQRSVHKGRPAR